MKKIKKIADLPNGAVVQYQNGVHVTRGIICRPEHFNETVVYTPSGYAGLTDDAERFWSAVEVFSKVYRSEAIQAEMVFRQRYA